MMVCASVYLQYDLELCVTCPAWNHNPGVYHKPPFGPDLQGLPVLRMFFFFTPKVFSEKGPRREEQTTAC